MRHRPTRTRALLTTGAIAAQLGLAGCDGTMPVPDEEEASTSEEAPPLEHDTTEVRPPDGNVAFQASPSSPIQYHGGPVMLGTVNVYYIWYGSWTNDSAVTILTDLASSMGGSPYFHINTTYKDGMNRAVTGSVKYLKATSDAYSRGKSLSDADIRTIVTSAITSGRLPKDGNAVYFVLTSADVNLTSGFCTMYCGWHTYANVAGTTVKYSFVGNSNRCPRACSMGQAPNGNAGADGMASVIAHELQEATTDPLLNAWYDGNGQENADKCAWTFGPMSGPAGKEYNVTIGKRHFLIQRNWVNAAGGFCATAY